MKLSELQSQFGSYLQANSSSSAFLLNQVQQSRLPKEDCISIYRNNFLLSLTQVLSATFPYSEKIIGTECFNQLAKLCIQKYPPLEADCSQYGEKMISALDEAPHITACVPYLTEVFNHEWHIDRLIYSEQEISTIRPIDQLHQITEQQQRHISFQLPTGFLVKCQFDLFAILDAIDNNQFESLEIEESCLGYVHIINQQVIRTSLTQEEFDMAQRLLNSATLSDIPEHLLPQLTNLFEKGLITGFLLTKPL